MLCVFLGSVPPRFLFEVFGPESGLGVLKVCIAFRCFCLCLLFVLQCFFFVVVCLCIYVYIYIYTYNIYI